MGAMKRQLALENPYYDRWKLASPPEWDETDQDDNAIDDGEDQREQEG